MISPQNQSLDPQSFPSVCHPHPLHYRYLLQLSQAGCKAAGVRAVERTLQVRGGLAGHRLHRPQWDNPWEGVCRGRDGPGHGHPQGAHPKDKSPRPPRTALEVRAGGVELQRGEGSWADRWKDNVLVKDTAGVTTWLFQGD